jgi:hypothetical protein
LAKSFGLIFWGLLLAFVDVRLGGFDVLLDAAGYAMIAVGAGRLAGAAPGFRSAATVAWLLIVPGLVDSVQPLGGGGLPGLLRALEIVGQGALSWTLLTGIAVFTGAGGRPGLARRARRLRAAEVVLAAAGLLLHLAPLRAGDKAAAAIVLAIPTLVLLGMVLLLVRRVRSELKPEAAVPRSWQPSASPRRV